MARVQISGGESFGAKGLGVKTGRPPRKITTVSIEFGVRIRFSGSYSRGEGEGHTNAEQHKLDLVHTRSVKHTPDVIFLESVPWDEVDELPLSGVGEGFLRDGVGGLVDVDTAGCEGRFELGGVAAENVVGVALLDQVEEGLETAAAGGTDEDGLHFGGGG